MAKKKKTEGLLPCVFYSLLCGLLVGVAIFFFKLIAHEVTHLSKELYTLAGSGVGYALLLFGILAVLALVMVLVHRFAPLVKGGGIPRSEGVLRGTLPFSWPKALLGTFLGSMISFFGGLPVGSEGPAVLIGTSLGGMCGRLSSNKEAWNRYVMSGGAGAGFAVATGAPLSGILFVLEEVHKRFTPLLVLSVSLSVVSAGYANQFLCEQFALSPGLLDVPAIGKFSLQDTLWLLLLCVGVALAVGLFDAAVSLTGRLKLKNGKPIPAVFKLLALFFVVGILGIFFPDAVFSGHDTIELAMESPALWLLLLLFVIRLFMMVFVMDSGATGGIFIPTLAIGALVAAMLAKGFVALGLEQDQYTAFLLLGMCAFLGGTIRAPLTATVFFLELTGQYENLLFVAAVTFGVYLFTCFFHQTPAYDRALEKMEEEAHEGKTPRIGHFEVVVEEGAFVVGKAVRDVMWPTSTVVLSICRADEQEADMDHDGEKILLAGDKIVVRTKYYDEGEFSVLLSSLTGKHSTPKRIN